MKLADAVRVGQEKSGKAIENRVQKQFGKPLTKGGIRQVFDWASRRNGYADSLLTQQLNNMLGGFIKTFKGNQIADNAAYNFVSDYVDNFDHFKNKEFVTANGRDYKIGNTPHIRDLIFCRDAIWAEIHKIHKIEEECTQVHQTNAYSQEEFDREYEEAMKEI
jgi:hypothetical protein